jgi:hypothetical protein
MNTPSRDANDPMALSIINMLDAGAQNTIQHTLRFENGKTTLPWIKDLLSTRTKKDKGKQKVVEVNEATKNDEEPESKGRKRKQDVQTEGGEDLVEESEEHTQEKKRSRGRPRKTTSPKGKQRTSARLSKSNSKGGKKK